MEYQKLFRSSSRPSTSTPLTKAATYAGFTGPQNVRCRRRLVYDDDFGDGDQRLQHLDRHNNNNNNNISNNSTNTAINATTTSLVDELEQLRTDNFQLRLRVYNAERRVDRLSASRNGNPKKRNDSSSDSDTGTCSDSTTDHSGGGGGDGGVRAGKTHDDQAIAAAKAKATAEAAVRTIHDLLTVNKRLLALLAATVSAKAVAVSADDKRRWQRLRNHIDNNYDQDYAEEDEETRRDSNTESDSSTTTTTDSETCMTRLSAERAATASNKRLIPSPPTPPPPPPLPPAHNELAAADDDSPGSELARLRARCRRLERSLQQLVNTELWARNRQIGKLEQQRYVTQVADAAAQRERQQMMNPSVVPSEQSCSKAAPTVTSPPVTKGILVKRSPSTGTKTPPTAEVATAAGTAVVITTPPPVLPDYSEVNFFFSCDEVDEEDESESNTLSSAEEDTDQSDDVDEEEPARSVPAAGHPLHHTTPSVTADSPTVRPRKRQRRKGGAEQVSALTTSSSTDSVPMTGGGGITTTTTSPTQSRRMHQRRRRRRTTSGPGRFSMCGRCGGGGVKNGPPTTSAGTADAQVQCSDPENGGASKSNKTCNDQLLLLRRELDARRRENSRLYDMLLRLQRGRDRRKDDNDGREGPKSPPSDLGDADARDVSVDSNSDRADSPEPYRRATRAVRGRIADLLPPLLSSRSTSVAPAVDAQRGSDELCLSGGDGGAGEQQQQLLLLSRLRERILAYERQELLGGDDNSRLSLSSSAAAASAMTDSEDAVRRMDRAALVNVALPRAVDRLRRALVPLMQQQPEEPAPIDRVMQDSPLERRTLVQLSASGDDDDRRR